MAYIKILELTNPRDFGLQGTTYRTPRNQLLRKIGVHNTIAFGTNESGPFGCVRSLKDGKCWDWWLNDWGDVVVVPAR